MFYGASIPISNYDNMLIAWSQLPPYTGLSFDAGDSYYCTGESARQRLVDNVVYDWTISDLGKDCDRMRFTSPDTVNVKSGQRTVLTPTLIASEAYALGIMPGVADGDLFEIANGVLRFKSAPDHNTPADKNGDNIYRVQLVAQGVITSYSIHYTKLYDIDNFTLSCGSDSPSYRLRRRGRWR